MLEQLVAKLAKSCCCHVYSATLSANRDAQGGKIGGVYLDHFQASIELTEGDGSALADQL